MVTDFEIDPSHPQFVAGFKEGHKKGRLRGIAQVIGPLGGEDSDPLSVFAKECTVGAYSEEELGKAALIALGRAANIKKSEEVTALWMEAVIEELVNCGIYMSRHDTDPVKALKDAIEWNVHVALDLRAQNSVPLENSDEARQAIDKMLAEYEYPSNPMNAARAGWRAARLYGQKS